MLKFPPLKNEITVYKSFGASYTLGKGTIYKSFGASYTLGKGTIYKSFGAS
jgi:hypothetical protein